MKFADDTKIAAVVSDKDGVDQIQMDLVNLYKWSCDWQMLFNVDKCKVLHFGGKNMDSRCVYTLGPIVIKPASEEKELLCSSHLNHHVSV